jgi:molybdopterin-guanine dinucleotide biosynthesis protein A
LPELRGLILAGGLGSRLAADGVAEAKPLVRVGGVPQVVRIARALQAAGCGDVVCMVRDDLSRMVAGALEAAAERDLAAAAVHLVPCRTPSSLHTLVAGLEAAGADAVLCTMVDTCMPERDWIALGARAARGLAEGEDLLLAVTPFAGDDERPLFVDLDDAGRVRRVGETPGARPLVTGGVYALAPAAQRLAHVCAAAGLERMRAFLAHAASRLSMGAIEIGRMIDLDHRADRDAAEDWLATSLNEE